MDTVTPNNWFEQNPKKTLVSFVLACALMLDTLAGHFFIPGVFTASPYFHHGYRKNYREPMRWGTTTTVMYTNSLGFKDRANRQVPLTTSKHRITFIGDSFTEGVGVPYELTFPGVIESQLDAAHYDVLNAGVQSYSPKLYYYKMKYFLEQVGLRTDELVVFVDYSDVPDEVMNYATFQPMGFFARLFARRGFDTFAVEHSALYRYLLRPALVKVINHVKRRDTPAAITHTQESTEQYYEKRRQWLFDDTSYNSWGKEGLARAADYMGKLYDLCNLHHVTMTLAVYPWPSLLQHPDAGLLWVRFWQDFSEAHHIDFINYFPDFARAGTPSEVVDRDFIRGDVHWNENGHRLVAEQWLRWYHNKSAAGAPQASAVPSPSASRL